MKNELQQLFCYLQFDTVGCKLLVCTSVAKHCRLLYANILVYYSIILSYSLCNLYSFDIL